MDATGLLEAGDYIKMIDGHVYFVDVVTRSGAHLIKVSGTPGLIRTSKRNGSRTKEVIRHDRKHVVIAGRPGMAAALVDPRHLDLRLMNRRIEMARKEDVNETPAATTAAPEAPKAEKERVTQKYKLTGKQPKSEMRGQGALVMDALKAATEPQTVGDLTKVVVATGKLATRQDAERVVGFYCSKFKREGIVDVVKVEAPAAGAPAAAEAGAPVGASA